MPSPTKILITGVQGLIAGAVLAELRRDSARYEMYGVDRRPEPWDYEERVAGRALPQDRFRIADLSDPHAVRRAVEGMDVVLHFGAASRPEADWHDVLSSNIVGTYNVFEASRECGVKRVIYASSTMVCWGYLLDEPYRAIRERRFDDLPAALPMLTKTSPPRPSDTYASSKLWGEALGRVYADVHGLSVICLRFGWVNERDLPWKPDLASVWCSKRDAVQMIRKSIEVTNDVRFDILFGVSANLHRWVDIDHARDVLGYAPQDRAEDHLDVTGLPRSPAS
jgi:nucleoside-diphosphate-sugar epimerase